jgi:hypothetical protein
VIATTTLAPIGHRLPTGKHGSCGLSPGGAAKMGIGLLFALLAVLCGVAVTRVVRAPLSMAPLIGLASMAVLTRWCVGVGAPPLVSSILLVGLALVGLVVAVGACPQVLANARANTLSTVLLVGSVAVPALLLGFALGNVEVPLSTHDGAFHVEVVESLRLGTYDDQTWYPRAFHASVAAVLGLVPWLDTARGTAEAALGLAVLAPLFVFAFVLRLGLTVRTSALCAATLALTYLYPYEFYLWAGWPQGMGVLLLFGLWSAALGWIEQPGPRWASVGGLFAGAILLTHGTEVYSATLGLAVIALMQYRRLAPTRLLWQLPLAVGVAIVVAAPYLPTLIGWAGSGGATGVGQGVVDFVTANPDLEQHSDFLQFTLSAVGATSWVELPVRLALVAVALRFRRAPVAIGVWAAFSALLFIVDFVHVPLVERLYALTFPWLDDRPRQIVVVMGSVLAANGLALVLIYVAELRTRLARLPNMWRRGALATVLLVAFFAEGSAVSISKRLTQAVGEQDVYSSDDRAAMGWLKEHTQPGEVVANDLASDAGIWAPYKADVAILLPRTASGSDEQQRRPILSNMVDMSADPAAAAEACALHVDYLYHGALPRPSQFDEKLVPDLAALQRAPDLEEVFSSGDAAVFRVHLPCA